MCSTQTKVVRPGWVRSKEGLWYVVIQSSDWGVDQVSGERSGIFSIGLTVGAQVLTSSECLYRGKHCEYIPSCYR